MRIAILSDIHGNLTAFQAVVRDIRDAAPDLILHGGDLADGGSSPVEIIDHIRDQGWPGVVGNTDELLAKPEVFDEFARQRPQLNSMWQAVREMADVTRSWLGEDRLGWMRQLPLRQMHGTVAFVHAHPESCWKSPLSDASDTELESCYGVLERPIAAYGHIHVPFVRETPSLIVANSGSVGMPFDDDRRASYLLIDGNRAQLRRVEYDVNREIRLLRECGLPHVDWLERILATGDPRMP
ncbi:MAG TPA: metallophosphoesterase family protein [Terriglobia bacterium]|nr:metallophosphoesterase family protein [Terriglobia bacterium]